MGSHTFEVEALLLVLPATDYQKRVPVAIGTTITDMAVGYSQNHPTNVSQSWKVVSVPPSLDNWYRHSQYTNILLKLPSQLLCHPLPHPPLGEVPS